MAVLARVATVKQQLWQPSGVAQLPHTVPYA